MLKTFADLKTNKKGFTLIELLVVIAIIGVLSGMVLVSMSGIRGRARDVRRLSDLDQIRKALELYYITNEQYPPLSSWRSSNNASAWGSLATELSSYIALPEDPSSVDSPGVQCPSRTYNYSGTITIGMVQR